MELTMLDILEIKQHALDSADAGKTKEEACPYDETSLHGQLWLDYFYARIRDLSGETSA